jgi:hypothetical protein
MLSLSLDNHDLVTRLRGGQTITWRGAWTGKAPARSEDGFTRVCCYCKRSQMVDGTWKLIINDIENSSHTFCPKCRKTALREFNQALQEERAARINFAKGLVVAC